MEYTMLSILCFCFVAAVTTAQDDWPGPEGPCFNFKKNVSSYIEFSPNNFINNDKIHYTLTFRTIEPSGVLMYSRGSHGDEEALFIRNGKLAYHLFNTSPHGIEGYFGGFFEGEQNVNSGVWITVHVYRMSNVEDMGGLRSRNQTGMVVQMGRQTYHYVDYIERSDITLEPNVYIGGYREPLSETIGNFVGQIKDIREEKNKVVFENPSVNYGSKVELGCPELDFNIPPA